MIRKALPDDDVREIVGIGSAVALRVYECAPKFLDVTAKELLPQWSCCCRDYTELPMAM